MSCQLRLQIEYIARSSSKHHLLHQSLSFDLEMHDSTILHAMKYIDAYPNMIKKTCCLTFRLMNPASHSSWVVCDSALITDSASLGDLRAINVLTFGILIIWVIAKRLPFNVRLTLLLWRCWRCCHSTLIFDRDLCHVTYNTVFSVQHKPFVVVLLKIKGLQVTGDMRHIPQFVCCDRLFFSAFFIQNPIRPRVHVTYGCLTRRRFHPTIQ